MIIEAGQPFQDPGVLAEDKLDGDVTSKVEGLGAVDTLKPGEYEVVYIANDKSDNRAVEQVRKVVVQDRTAPVIELRLAKWK